MNPKTIRYFAWAVFALGAYLRMARLASAPLWIDEALFASWAKGIPRQEFLTVMIAKLLPESEFFLRLPVALCGSLTVLFFYYCTGGGWKSMYGSALVAVFPIFVFWSRVARPYAVAGLFVVLGWRWWGFYAVAVLTTPVALLGINIVKLKEKRFRWIYGALVVLAGVVYVMRPDVTHVGAFFDLSFLVNEKRIWYVPLLTCLLYCCTYIPDRYFTAHPGQDVRST